MKDTHIEHEHMSKYLDESFHNIGGHPSGGAGHAPIGGGIRPSVGISPTPHPSVTPQQAHLRMVRNFYRRNPPIGYVGRNFGLSPIGRRWFYNHTPYLFGYSYAFLYPLFLDLDSGIYDEYILRRKYNLSDEEWQQLIYKLEAAGYLVTT